MVKLIFSRSICGISTIKMSRDFFKFSEVGLDIYLGLHTLLQNADNLIMPRIKESNGGIDTCGERLKTVLIALFSFS